MEHRAFFHLDLAVLELSGQHLLGKQTFLHLRLLQCQTDLRLGTRGLHDIQPLLTGLLIGGSEYLHLITTLQLLTDRHHPSVDTSARTGITDLRMDMVGKVEHRSPHRKLMQVATRRKDKDLILVEFHLKLVHRLHAVRTLQHVSDSSEPLVEPCLTLHTLIAPMGSHTSLSNLVHTFRAYLHLHPFLLRTEHCDMQTLITIRLGYTKPVAQTLRIRLVHIRHYRIGLPTLHLLLFNGTVDDDTDGEEVIDTFEGTLLLLHLLPDAVDALRATLDVTVDTCCLHLLLYWFDETVDIGITGCFRLTQFFADMVVGVVLHILKREVFEFTLQLIESEFMSQRRIEISRFLAHLDLCLLILRVAYLAHQVHTVGNHNKDHAHVLSQ